MDMLECQQGNQGSSAEYGSHAASPVFGPDEAPTDEAAEWRSTRSSQRPGKPATWRRGAG